MSQKHSFNPKSTASSSASIRLEYSLPSDVRAISPFVDALMLLVRNCHFISGSETDVEIALREALDNAVVHGNHEDPLKHVCVRCQCELGAISVDVKDEGQGFDIDRLPDPTTSQNISSPRGRGIFLMRALMDEVQFEKGGALVHMRKSVPAANLPVPHSRPL